MRLTSPVALALTLAFTLACYIALFTTPGTPDVGFWLRWIDLMRAHGTIGGYALAASDYGPAAFSCLRIVTWVGDAFGLGTFAALKLTIVLIALGSALFFWQWTRNLWHATWFLLALSINTVAHAYLDVFYLPFLLRMLWALQRDRMWLAGVCLGIALCFKWQPLLLAPFVVVYAGRRAGVLLAGMALPLAAQVALVGIQPMAQSLARATHHHALSNQALNIYWVLQMALYKAYDLSGPFFMVSLSRPLLRVTQVLFLVTYVTVLAALWRRRPRDQQRDPETAFADFLWCAFTGSLVYFSLNAGVHENHLFVAMVLGFWLLMTDLPHRVLACAFVAIAANINLLLFYGLDGRTPPDPAWANPATIIVSVINTAFLGWCLYLATSRMNWIKPSK